MEGIDSSNTNDSVLRGNENSLHPLWVSQQGIAPRSDFCGFDTSVAPDRLEALYAPFAFYLVS
jgi:hypothetical protein